MTGVHTQRIEPVVHAGCSTKSIQRLESKFKNYMSKAIHDYRMIQKGDKVLVCVSGGKDSLTMALMMKQLQETLSFDMFVFVLDQSQPGWDDKQLRVFFEEHDLPYEIMTRNTYAVVKEKVPENKTYCGLCSRLRRGNIYQYARDHGFNKIALGHHRDDLIQTLMMSIMFNGRIKTMPPKLLTDTKEHIVIRPLCYIQEQDIKRYAKLMALPIIPCTLCGTQPNMMRQKVKNWLNEWTQMNPKIPSNMLRALQQVDSSHLMDKTLWDFEQLESQQMV